MTVFAGSDEFIRAGIAADKDDVVTGTVNFGLGVDADTPPATWVAGEWESNQKQICQIDGKYIEAYVARIMSSALNLTAGSDHIFTQVVLGPQSIIKYAGKVTVK